jgi:hypothetical protein
MDIVVGGTRLFQQVAHLSMGSLFSMKKEELGFKNLLLEEAFYSFLGVVVSCFYVYNNATTCLVFFLLLT